MTILSMTFQKEEKNHKIRWENKTFFNNITFGSIYVFDIISEIDIWSRTGS